MADLTTAARNRLGISDIKRRYDTGEISRDEAKRLAQPILDRINALSAKIATNHGKKNYPKLDFINAMRNSY